MAEQKRFVRLCPRFDRDETLSLLKAEIALQSTTADSNCGGHYKKYPMPVNWIRPKEDGQVEFYAIPGDFNLNRSPSFQSGRVYGMDATSGAAVLALLFDTYCSTNEPLTPADGKESKRDNETPLRVLDLCCAPGLKLCMIADLVPSSSTVVGVDLSRNRIQICKKIVKKYQIATNLVSSSRTEIQLYCTDGTTFGTTKQQSGLVFDSNAENQELSIRGKRQRQNKSARAREKRRLLELQRKVILVAGDGGTHSELEDETSGARTSCCLPLFDRVLVDAECSTDGAIRHIQKRKDSSKTSLWNDSNMSELVDLQQRLIESGFRLLKSGGSLVYSTCSLMEQQNENVVRWLLDTYNDAFIIPVSFNNHNTSEQTRTFMEEGSLEGTVRFNPLATISKGVVEECLPGAGFFLSKIGKK
jgi:16S rRNA C967 or C1407 C5-methylase (RsmB/RsmF family)